MIAMLENLSEIFNWILRGSLYSVAAVFIIVILQKLTRRALSARWRYSLWLILLARLVLPAGLETNWSLWNLTAPERWIDLIVSGEKTAADTKMPTASSAASGGDRQESMQSGENRFLRNLYGLNGFSPRVIRQALPVIWLAGALVMFACAAFVNLRLWNSVRGLSPATDSELLELFEDCKRQMRVKTMAGLVVADRVENPFLFGFIRPRVLLPAGMVRQVSSDQLRCVLLHELAHLKRGDIVTGWLLAILQSLHWFNPVIWWAFYRLRFDRETACDALVLSRMPDETRCHYGDALIGMLGRFNHPQHLPAIVAGIFENKKRFKRRLIMIKKFKTPSRREIIMAAVLLAVLSIALLTEPRPLLSQSQPDEQIVVIPDGISVNEVRIISRNSDGNVVIDADNQPQLPLSGVISLRGGIIDRNRDQPEAQDGVVILPSVRNVITTVAENVEDLDLNQMMYQLKQLREQGADIPESFKQELPNGRVLTRQSLSSILYQQLPNGRMLIRGVRHSDDTTSGQAFALSPIIVDRLVNTSQALSQLREQGVSGAFTVVETLDQTGKSLVYAMGTGDVPQILPELLKNTDGEESGFAWEEVSPGVWIGKAAG